MPTLNEMNIERACALLNAARYQVQDGWQVSNDGQWVFQHPNPDTVIRKSAEDAVAIATGIEAQRELAALRLAVESGFNNLLLDLYPMTIANAPLSASEQRLFADDMAAHIGKLRNELLGKAK